ncbi:MAG: TolC family outer membrane protein [Alphaproteobacteria bacterium]|nr:TolC family outer membrane protein [Alphaproteobacteria bacterium]
MTIPNMTIPKLIKSSLPYALLALGLLHSNAAIAQEAPISESFRENGLHLEQALRHVYEHNPVLQAARAELHAAQELYPQALAGWRPTLNAEAGIFATDIDSNNFSRGTGATTKDLTLSIEQPLFRGGRTTSQTARAKALIMAAQAQTLRTEQKIFLETTIAYLNVMQNRTVLELRRGNEHMLGEELTAARERFKAGAITITDIHHGESRLARARAQTQESMNALEASNAEFEYLTALSPDTTFYYPPNVTDLPQNLGEEIETAMEKNPDILAAKYAHKAAGHNADATLRELFPHIFAYASYNRQYDPQPGIIDEFEVETIGLKATLALYQGGATRSRLRQNRQTANQKYIEISEIKNRVRADITIHHKALKSAQTEITARLEEIEALKQAREGLREETLMGMRTTLDLLDADQELLTARTALAAARRNAAVASFSIAKNAGLLTPDRFGIPDHASAIDTHFEETRNLFAETSTPADSSGEK